ncbi:MAG TPA: siderophore-interacting protein [Acidimicrobiales bacterium]
MPTMPVRREPPKFRLVTVRRKSWTSARLVRVTLGGPEQAGFEVAEPAASVRLLLPSDGPGGELVVPAWNGNEFLLPDGRRPVIRTLTPLAPAGGADDELDVEVVVHDGGAVSTWAVAAEEGAPAAVSGPGRGYMVDTEAPAYLLAGDETALPALGQVQAALPAGLPVQAHVEVADEAAVLPRPGIAWHVRSPGAAPGDALVAAVTEAAAGAVGGTRYWVAGEAAAVQRIRRHLFQELDVPRAHTSIRGYWKHGRTGSPEG